MGKVFRSRTACNSKKLLDLGRELSGKTLGWCYCTTVVNSSWIYLWFMEYDESMYIYIYYRFFSYIYNIFYLSIYIYILFLTYTVYCNYIQLSYVKDLQDLSGAGSARNIHLVELGTHQQKMYVFRRSKKNMVFGFKNHMFLHFSRSTRDIDIYIYIYTHDIYYHLYIYTLWMSFWDLLIKPKFFQPKANKNDLLDQMSSISERI